MYSSRDNSLRIGTWMVVAVLLLSWGRDVVACYERDRNPAGEVIHISMADGEDQHCQTLTISVFVQHDCEQDCCDLQQALPQRDSDLLHADRTDRPILSLEDWSNLLPIRGPPRDEFPPSSTASAVSIPHRLSFCCLRI